MAAVFSYAEAAKGLTPTASTTPTEKTSESTQVDSQNNTKPQAEIDSSNKPVEESPAAIKTADNTADAPPAVPAAKAECIETSSNAQSEQASAVFGVESTATLSKDDDVNGAIQDGSESTMWEKVSQGSQSGDKGSKADDESNDSKSSNWESVSVPSLKDAPPPAVNPWLKRAQDMQSKISSIVPMSPTSNAKIASEAIGKKKARSSETNEMMIDKTSGIKPRTDDVATRRYRPASETKALATMPPPATDAVSWPTPDLAAKPEDRKRSISEGKETTEQEKLASSKHGKKEWVSMPFVPTPVFNTPLPTSRRGGRPGGRGGRDALPGRPMTNGAGIDVAERSPSLPRGDASVDGSKADTASTRQGPSTRQKRMSSTGQTRPRDLRKGEEARDDRQGRPFDQESVTTQGTSRDFRRNKASSERGDTAQRQPFTPVEQKHAGLNGMNGDFSKLPFDPTTHHNRKFDMHHGNRELGSARDPRSERGGRGYRGRGGHGPPQGGQGPFTNIAGFYQPSYSPTKGAHEQRSMSHPSYGGVREGRHIRNGSRSQSGAAQQYAPRYGVHPAAGMGFPPVGSDMAAGYGIVPGMGPQYYHPYQDQHGLVSMIMEQMRYWFSFDNLIRDLYLRKRMDKDGFVPLSFLMPWKRMQALTTDIKLVRFACYNVPQLELRVDSEGNEYVRMAQGWDKWVMPVEERHEDAQRLDGPELFPVFPGQEMQNHQPRPQQQFSSKVPPMRMTNGSPSQQTPSSNEEIRNGTSTSELQTPLSATVPEFKPEGLLASKELEQAFASGESSFEAPRNETQNFSPMPSE